MSNSEENPKDWDVATKLIRGGLERTPYGEMSEAIFLTQSYVYASADQADARVGLRDGADHVARGLIGGVVDDDDLEGAAVQRRARFVQNAADRGSLVQGADHQGKLGPAGRGDTCIEHGPTSRAPSVCGRLSPMLKQA